MKYAEASRLAVGRFLFVDLFCLLLLYILCCVTITDLTILVSEILLGFRVKKR